MFINTNTLIAILGLVSAAPALAASAGSGSSLPSVRRSLASKLERRAEKIARQNNNPQTSLQLDPSQVAKNLAKNGQEGGGDPGQVPSLTSTNNFINFCLTQNVQLTNGLQIKEGSCNGVPMGRIASINNMPSCKWTFPKNGQTIPANQAFTLQLAVQHLNTGNFVNPNTNYYGAPQQVDNAGDIIGHGHAVIQLLPSLDSTAPLDPAKFAFFKGLNNKATNGILSADVTAGLPAGAYRVCSINTAANHQPCIVAVAQHGSLDDCSYFTVANGGGNNGGNNNGQNGGNNGGNNNGQNGGNNGGNNNGQNGGNNGANNGQNGGNNNTGGQNNAQNGANNGQNGGNNNTGGQNNAQNGANNGQNGQNGGQNAQNGGGSGKATGGNFQTFTGSLGGSPPAVTTGPRGFAVNGDGFVNKAAALQRSCDIQKNNCANAANSSGNKAPLTVSACEAQQQQCSKAASA